MRVTRALGLPVSVYPAGAPAIEYDTVVGFPERNVAIPVICQPSSTCTVFTKPLPHGWILRKFAYADVDHPEGSGAYWDENELEHSRRKALLSVPTWEWAELDGPALVWAEKGVMPRALVNAAGPAAAKALYDSVSMHTALR